MDDIALWKAPQPGRNAAQEVIDGFDLAQYPGNGPYLAAIRAIAEEYQRHYQAGLQVFYLPRELFQDLLARGIILPDPFYPDGESYYVPSDGLAEFNMAVKQGRPNEFHP